jgi:trimeric autotransporter adhesin
LLSNTTGFSNIAIGKAALLNNTDRSNLVAIGDSALLNNGIGATQSSQSSFNTAVGSKSLYANTIGYGNTGVGAQSLQNNVSGKLNSAIGNGALANNTIGNGNIGTGYFALNNNDKGNSNVAMGVYAAGLSTTGNNLVAIGDSALYQYDNGITSLTSLYGNNTAVGAKALRGSTTGTINTAVGSFSMEDNTIGNFNVAVGNISLHDNITGAANVAIGMQSMAQNTSGGNNTAVGRAALYGNNSTGNNNVAIGSLSMLSNTSGFSNTAVGAQSLNSNTVGTYNVASGFQSLYSNTSSGFNTAVGAFTLFNHKVGNNNIAIGYAALNTDSSGYDNTGLGVNVLFNNKTGNSNTATGGNALYTNQSGSFNTANGQNALSSITKGDNNTAMGYGALSNALLVNKNTAIGYLADAPSTLSSNATAIGANAIANCSNCMVLGSVPGLNGGTSNINVGIGANNPQSALHINPNGGGSILIGTNRTAGGYTNLEMGISTQSNGFSYIQSTKASGSTWGNLQLNPSGGNVTTMGNVGIGTNNPLYPLDIIQPDNNQTIAIRIITPGDIWTIGNAKNSGYLTFLHNGQFRADINKDDGSYTTYSDKRMKKNIEDLTPVLSKVLQLKAKNYQSIDADETTKKSTGFISQEVIGLFPELVSTFKRTADDPTLYLGLNYAGFGVIAIKAIQEQQALIETLQTNNKVVQSEMDLLKAQNKLMLEQMAKMQAAIDGLGKK